MQNIQSTNALASETFAIFNEIRDRGGIYFYQKKKHVRDRESKKRVVFCLKYIFIYISLAFELDKKRIKGYYRVFCSSLHAANADYETPPFSSPGDTAN